jgi:integrase
MTLEEKTPTDYPRPLRLAGNHDLVGLVRLVRSNWCGVIAEGDIAGRALRAVKHAPHESRSRRHRLTQRFVDTVKEEGEYPDGDGLYLRVGSGGRARSWMYRYQLFGEQHRMGLGPVRKFALIEARRRVEIPRQQVYDGIDPIKARKEDRRKKKLEAARRITFHACAEQWVGLQNWKPKTENSVRVQLRKHLEPILGKLLVHAIDDDRVDTALSPVWKTRTGKGLQNILERILDWATAKKFCLGDNPARLKAVQARLGRYRHISKHYADLPFEQMPAFMARLRAHRDKKGERPLSSYTIEFAVLTAVRKGQARMAKWSEIDVEKRIWVCPPEGHKTGERTQTDYVIVLSDQAMAVLDTMRAQQEVQGIKSEYVFVGGVPKRLNARHQRAYGAWIGKLQSETTLNHLLWKLWPGITLHGFRTSFGDFSVEHGFDERDSEMALGHKVGNDIRNIYKRHAQRIEPRRLMMQAWADFCDRTEPLSAEIVPFRKNK